MGEILSEYTNILFLLKHLPANFIIHLCFFSTAITIGIWSWGLCRFLISSTFISGSSIRKSCLFSAFYLRFLFIAVWTQGYLFYPLGYDPNLLLFILFLKLFQGWPLGALWIRLLCPFNIPCLYFLYFSTTHLDFFFPRNQPLLQGVSWFLLFKNSI